MLQTLGHGKITLFILQNTVLGYHIRTQYTQQWNIAIGHSIWQHQLQTLQ